MRNTLQRSFGPAVLAHREEATEWLMALALASLAYAFAISLGQQNILILALAAVLLVIFVVIIFRQHMKFRFSAYNMQIAAVIAVYLLFNIVINSGNYSKDPTLSQTLAHILGFVAYLFALSWLVSNLDARRVLGKLALALIPLTIMALANQSETGYGRFTPFGLQPNWWGELMVALTISALAVNAWFIRLGIYVLAAFVLFFVQSRSGMVGWAVVIGVELVRAFHRLTSDRRLMFTLLVVVAGGLVVAYTPVVSFVLNKVLLLNNPYRGLHTGFTGRTAGWEVALAAFAHNPIFGQGMDRYRYVHNGFLQTISEGGLVLGAIVGVIWWNGLRLAWREVNYVRVAGLLAASGYIFFQPRMFNLNLTSLIFWLALYKWKGSLGEEHARRVGGVAEHA